jgi:aminoglycoside 3-N-acetyltransferase
MVWTMFDRELQAGDDRPPVTRNAIVEGLAAIGLPRGAAVMVHSSLSAFGHVQGGADAVIDALLAAVGDPGLVVVPTHTWGTVNARQPVFHVRLSPSIVGRITETFRHRPDAVRSEHPTHSVAAIGAGAAAFVAGHAQFSTPCAPDSPYGRLVKAQGWVLMLGINLSRFTLMHGFEEWAPAPWVFDRVETLYTILDDGRILTVPSQRHTADPGCARDYPALEPLLESRGILRRGTIGAAAIRLIDAGAAAELLVPMLRQQPDLFLKRRREPAPTR